MCNNIRIIWVQNLNLFNAVEKNVTSIKSLEFMNLSHRAMLIPIVNHIEAEKVNVMCTMGIGIEVFNDAKLFPKERRVKKLKGPKRQLV